MIQLLCSLLQLKCARLTDVCPDSDSFFPNYSRGRDVSWWLALSPCVPSCLPACPQPKSAAAQGLSRSLTSAETSHHSYTAIRGVPTPMWLRIWHLGGKNESLTSLLVAEFLAAVPPGCWWLLPGARGASPARVRWAL